MISDAFGEPLMLTLCLTSSTTVQWSAFVRTVLSGRRHLRYGLLWLLVVAATAMATFLVVAATAAATLLSPAAAAAAAAALLLLPVAFDAMGSTTHVVGRGVDQTLFFHVQVQTPPEWVRLPGPTKGIEKVLFNLANTSCIRINIFT